MTASGASGLARCALGLVLVLATLPGATVALAQDAPDCDDLSAQIDSADADLNQLRLDATPWLVDASQLSALVTSDLLVGAQHGADGLTPENAVSFGAIALQIGVAIDGWRSGHQNASTDGYWRDLATALSAWEGLFGGLLPVQANAPSAVGMSAAFSQLDSLAARAQGDLGLVDSLGKALQACQGQASGGSPTPVPAPSPDAGTAAGGDGLCSVSGQTGFSNSDCFRLELDAAYAEWSACLDDYFAAERAAFVDGGDLPTNTCDPAFAAQQDALQKRWVGGGN
jgi:hypothetical protein